MSEDSVFIHKSADVEEGAVLGPKTSVWHRAHVRKGATLGASCVIGKDVYIDTGVIIGNNCKIQNGVSVFQGVTLEDGVFCGPHMTFTNDKSPRAINPDGSIKSGSDWVVSKTLVKYGAAIGAHATIVSDITIGRWAMVAAGAVVTKDVPDHALVAGVPAKVIGYVSSCGKRLETPPPASNKDCDDKVSDN